MPFADGFVSGTNSVVPSEVEDISKALKEFLKQKTFSAGAHTGS